MPSNGSAEHRIASAARISFNNFNATKSPKEDAALVKYLYENSHTSPLEMVEFMFEIYCPQFVATHLHRHRTANINEQSQRYTEVDDNFYRTSTDIRRQSTTNKQGSIQDDELSTLMYPECVRVEDIISNQLLPAYHKLIDSGIAKEVARAYLPRAVYTKMVYKMDASNLLKFLSLRCALDSQKETKVFANAMKALVQPIIPTLIQCLDDRLHSIVLRPDEIKAFYSGRARLASGSIRRDAEFKSKLDRIRPSISRKLFVLIGYKTTGKDTLADRLIRDEPYDDLWWNCKLPECHDGIRLSLADALKDEVHSELDRLGIPYVGIDKDAYYEGSRLSLRDRYIEHGRYRRQQDVNYWLNVVLDKIEANQENDIIVTDCRFLNELEAFKHVVGREVITIRIYRSNVEVPGLDIESEHDLDACATDYLMTDTITSMIDASSIFPQYRR